MDWYIKHPYIFYLDLSLINILLQLFCFYTHTDTDTDTHRCATTDLNTKIKKAGIKEMTTCKKKK